MKINDFWKTIKKKLQKKTKVQIDIDTLKNEFFKIFNEKLINTTNSEEIDEINKFTEEVKNQLSIKQISNLSY